MAELPRLLLISSLLSKHLGTKSNCEELIEFLRASGWGVLGASDRRNRALRLLDVADVVVRRRRRYDVAYVDVFSHKAFTMAEVAVWLLRRLGKPTVLNLQGGDLPTFAHRHPRRVGAVLAAADEVIAPSGYLAEGLRSLRTDITTIPNAIRIERYPFRHRRRIRPSLVWVRAFHSIYAPQVAVEILARLRERHPDAELTMVGPDKLDGSLEATRELAARRSVTDRVKFVGPVDKGEVPGWMARGDLFLNTTTVDNFPVTVLEAMACGLCVVSTDVGGLPHLVEDGVNGRLVPPDDPDAMAEAALDLLDSEDAAARVSSEARNTAEACDWAPILDRWKRVFRDLAAGPR